MYVNEEICIWTHRKPQRRKMLLRTTPFCFVLFCFVISSFSVSLDSNKIVCQNFADISTDTTTLILPTRLDIPKPQLILLVYIISIIRICRAPTPLKYDFRNITFFLLFFYYFLHFIFFPVRAEKNQSSCPNATAEIPTNSRTELKTME